MQSTEVALIFIETVFLFDGFNVYILQIIVDKLTANISERTNLVVEKVLAFPWFLLVDIHMLL